MPYNTLPNPLVILIMFQKNQIVWAHIEGFPLWPATVLKIITNSPDNYIYYDVSFIGESSRALIKETDVFEFDTNRPEFTPSEGVLKEHKLLGRALKSAALKLQKSKPKFQSSGNQGNKSPQKALPRDIKAQLSSKKRRKRNTRKQRNGSPQVSVSENECKTYPPQQQSVSASHRREKSMTQEESSPKRATPNKSDRSPQKLNKSDKQSSDWKLAISHQVLEQLSRSISKRSSNPIKASIDRVPIQSFFYEQLPQLPQRQTSQTGSDTNSPMSKKQRLAQKRKQKEEYKIQQLNKTLSNYITFQPNCQNTPEVKLARQVQFKLECIVFLILDTSSTNDPLKAKLKELRSIFDVQKIGPQILMNSKISSLLSFISNELKGEFSEERQWIEKNISIINHKVLEFMNNTEFYENVLNATRNFGLPSEKSSSVNNLDVQESEQKQKPKVGRSVKRYKSKITDMLRVKKGFSEEDVAVLTGQIMEYLSSEGLALEKKWEELRERVDTTIYEDRDHCYRDLKEFVFTS